MSTQEVEKQDVGYETPPIDDLLTLLLKNRRATGAYNEVWPRVFISDAATARDKTLLRRLGITHILNAADGPQHIHTGAEFYWDTHTEYLGIEAADSRHFSITPFLQPAADYIHHALQDGGTLLVHCARGVSRSSTLVLAYLMIYEHLSIADAIAAVSAHRNILPNAGFLQQLRVLDASLMQRETHPHPH
ncbi:dual specificity protein phosphatase 13B-like isoform X1 [Danio rerio]|uniref:Dual specificity protein phosphatase 13B-like isoform X1 n=1 Tax=Danio rerio TaxID=7955 RepID=A0AC58GZK4_DANRE